MLGAIRPKGPDQHCRAPIAIEYGLAAELGDATNEKPSHHPDWINSHALETGLTISHLRGASNSGMPTVYDWEDRTRALAGDDDRLLAALRSGSSPGRCRARSCYATKRQQGTVKFRACPAQQLALLSRLRM